MTWSANMRALLDGARGATSTAAPVAPRALADASPSVAQSAEDVPLSASSALAFDPSEHTVQEVSEYLAHADPAERKRVIAAERDGRGRVSILSQG